jgi:hypothetical protein
MKNYRWASAVAMLATFAACSPKESPEVTSSDRPGALIIAYSSDSADTFVANRADSVLALDWLREVVQVHQLEFRAKSFAYGTLVEQIGYRQNGDGGYWLYKVNNQMVPKSADAHIVAWNDTLTFFFDER